MKWAGKVARKGDQKCIQHISRTIRREETIWETLMGVVILRNTESLLDASKDVRLETDAEKTE
jgi:hypothetical protein